MKRPPAKPHVVVLAVDGLHTAFPGAYGNSWIATPALDRFACEAALLDRYYTNTLDLSLLYREFWYGLHPDDRGPGAARHEEVPPETPSLVSELRDVGYRTVLLSDDPAVAYNLYAEGFSEVHLLETPQDETPAESLEDTRFYRMFATILDLTTAREARPVFLWAHFRAFTGRWDFPNDFRESYVEQDDPAPYSATRPPLYDYRFSPNASPIPEKRGDENKDAAPRDVKPGDEPDPDELRSVVQAYSGGVTAFDEVFGMFYESFRESPLYRETIVGLLGTRGFSLGEHRFIGTVEEAVNAANAVNVPDHDVSTLWGEHVHLPFLLRFPQTRERGPALPATNLFRSSALAQPNDFHATLKELLELDEPRTTHVTERRGRSLLPLLRGDADTLRDRLVISGERGERAVVSPEWFFRRSLPIPRQNEPDAEHVPQQRYRYELFAKPGDRYEFNEVADRCEDVVEQFVRFLRRDIPDPMTSDP